MGVASEGFCCGFVGLEHFEEFFGLGFCESLVCLENFLFIIICYWEGWWGKGRRKFCEKEMKKKVKNPLNFKSYLDNLEFSFDSFCLTSRAKIQFSA